MRFERRNLLVHITHNRLQNKHGKIFHRRKSSLIVHCSKRTKILLELARTWLDSTRSVCTTVTLETNWTGLDWTRLDSVVGYASLEPLNYYSITNMMHLLFQIIYSCKTLYMLRTVFPSSGVQNCVYSNGICHTAAATCCYRGWDGVPSHPRKQQVAAAVWHITLLYTQFCAPDDGR